MCNVNRTSLQMTMKLREGRHQQHDSKLLHCCVSADLFEWRIFIPLRENILNLGKRQHESGAWVCLMYAFTGDASDEGKTTEKKPKTCSNGARRKHRVTVSSSLNADSLTCSPDAQLSYFKNAVRSGNVSALVMISEDGFL